MGKVSPISVPVTDAPLIAELVIQEPYILAVTWQDGSRTTHDLSATIRDQAWAAALQDADVFGTARPEDEGWQVVWPGTDVAFSASGLWEDAHPGPPAAKWMSAADFTGWMKEMDLSFAAAAKTLDVSQRMLKYYAAGTHEVPKTVWLACMHLAAEKSRRS